MATYRDFDNVGCDQVDAIEPAQDRPQLSRRPASRLGGARSRSNCDSGCQSNRTRLLFGVWSTHTSRVERVDVERQVDGVLGPDAVPDLLDDAVGADGVDLAGLDDLKAAVPVVLVVARPAQRRADPGVDVRVVPEQALLRGVVEVRPVVDAGHLGRRAAEHLGTPWREESRSERGRDKDLGSGGR